MIEIPAPYESAANALTIIRYPGKPDIIRRTRLPTQKAILDWQFEEFGTIGFLQRGGLVWMRTPSEQASFNRKLIEAKIPTIPIIAFTEKTTELYRSRATNFAKWLQYDPGYTKLQKVIFPALHKFHRAHHGFSLYLGDRWSRNMQRSGNYGVTHIDHDIGIEGPRSPELDITQFILDIVQTIPTKETIVSVFKRYVELHSLQAYHRPTLREFFRNYGDLVVARRPENMKRALKTQDTMYHLAAMVE